MRIPFLVLLLAGLVACSATESAPPDLFRLPLADAGSMRRVYGPFPANSVPGFEIVVRLLINGEPVTAPVVTAYENQRVGVSVLEQVGYVSRFRLEGSSGVRAASPVVEILLPGMCLDFEARNAGDDRICLAWAVRTCEVTRPMRERREMLPTLPEYSEGTIQLPEETRTTLSGRTLVDNARETSLLAMPWGREGRLEAAVRVVRLSLPPPGPGEQSERSVAADGEMPPLPAKSISVPTRNTGPFEVALVVLPDDGPLDPVTRGNPLARFRLNTVVEAGVRAEHLLHVSFVLDYPDYPFEEPEPTIPSVGKVAAGLRTAVLEEDGELILDWRYAALRSMERFNASISSAGPQLWIELPDVVGCRGRLPLRDRVNTTPVATLEDGRRIVLVVTTGL